MTKYGAKKIVHDGITFDSQLEGAYYLHLKEIQQKGEIAAFNLQPSFLLQESFKKDGKTIRKIEYVADFEILHHDETIEVVDIKGMITETAKLKVKLFQKKYPYKLSLITYVKKYGGWVELNELKRLRRAKK
jgi:hypothetical protein